MLLRWSRITVLLTGARIPWISFGFSVSIPSSVPVSVFLVVVIPSVIVLMLWWGRLWLVHRLVGNGVGLSVAFTPFGGLLFLSPVFLNALTVLDKFIDLTDDVLSVRQKISIFVDRRIPRLHFRPVDVGNIWERNETFAVRPVDLFYRPVPLKLCLAAFGTFNNLGRLVGICMHVWTGIAYERCRPWLVGIGKSGGFWDVPREVYDERNEWSSSTTPITQAALSGNEHKGKQRDRDPK